jgi:hypothetical protein
MTPENEPLALARIKYPDQFLAYMKDAIILYGGNLSLMATRLKVHRNTLNRWFDKSAALRSYLERVREHGPPQGDIDRLVAQGKLRPDQVEKIKQERTWNRVKK